MNNKYKAKFDKLEKEKSDWIKAVSLLNGEQQNVQNCGKWSVLEHGYHLYLAEKGSLAYVKKKLSYNPKLKKAGFRMFFKNVALWIFMTSPFKFKAPKAVSQKNFPDDLSIEILETAWDKSRLELKAFLDSIGDQFLGLEVYKQPFAGRLTLEGMLRFFILHQKRHFIHTRKQVKP